MVDLLEMRPKLKQDSVFIQTEDGVFLRGDENTFLLRGKSVYRWLSTLSPYLTGQYTLDQLCESLDESQQGLVRQLVQTLIERGILKHHIAEEPGILPDTVASYFRSQLEFIEHYTDYPQQKFLDFRESRILALGSGEALLALSKALLSNGIKTLTLDPSDEYASYREWLAPVVETFQRAGIEANVVAASASTSLTMYDLVVYCSEESSPGEIARLNQQCIDANVPFLAATIFADKAFIGPYVKRGDGPCWLCAQLRLAANNTSECNNALWRGLALGDVFARNDAAVFPVLARRIGTGLAFEIFKLRAGHLPSETQNGVIVQDLETLESYRAELVSHPLCPVCAHYATDTSVTQLYETVEGKRDRDLSDDDILPKAARYIDPHVGLWHQFTDDDMIQVPVKMSSIQLGSPATLRLEADRITAFGIDTVLDARLAVLRKSVSEYSRHLLDSKGIIRTCYNDLLAQGKEAVLPQHLALWMGSMSIDTDECIEWIAGYSYTKQRVLYVPAAAAYPTSSLNRRGLFEKTMAGSAAGLTYRETFTEGLLSAMAYEQLSAVTRRQSKLVKIEYKALQEASSDLAFLLKSAQRFGQPFTSMYVAGDTPVHTVVASTLHDPHIMAVGCALSALDAAYKALLDLTGNLQLWQTEHRLAETRESCFSAFCLNLSMLQDEPQMIWQPQAAKTVEQVSTHLQTRGQDIIFVNTTSADIWATETFMSGRVLLTRDAL